MGYNYSALGKVIIELKDDPTVASIVVDRVAGFEPEPGWSAADAGPDGPRFKHAYIVAVDLDAVPEKRVPVQRPRIALRCYGRTPVEAAQLVTAAHNALHGVGPRVHSNGLGIYVSWDETGGTAESDPDTHQPYYTMIIELVATTQAVA